MQAFIIFDDGEIIEGCAFGAAGTVCGELVFNTSMGGSREIVSDPAYFGQIVTLTYPLTAEWGGDGDGRPGAAAMICREEFDVNNEPGHIDGFLKQRGVIGIGGIDTRHIATKLREAGRVVKAVCTTESMNKDAAGALIKDFEIKNATGSVSVNDIKKFGEGSRSVAVLDFGYNENMLNSLIKRGCSITLLPHNTPAESILAGGYGLLVLSNGPGNPAENNGYIETIKTLCGKIPMLAIGLGMQILALAQGGSVSRLPVGHRGANIPVKSTASNRIYITAQNHGYAVDSCPDSGEISYVNVNDGTVAGIDYKDINAVSVQFLPESEPGPIDAGFIYDDILKKL